MLWSPARLTGGRRRPQKGSIKMTGAMYAAIGGLKTHMTKLNVIGNNLANVNTYGYKAQRMTFRESIYGMTKSGSNGTALMGGNNPSQIGYGCSVGSIDLNMSPSTYSPTGYPLDCMLTGEGFFMVGEKINYEIEEITDEDSGLTEVKVSGHGITTAADLTKPYLTRVGDFWIDSDGYICNRDNQVLYGFARVQNPNYIPNPTKAQLDAAKLAKINIEDETIISTELVPLRVPLSAAAPTVANGGKVQARDENDQPMWELDEEGEPTTTPIYMNLWEEGDPVYPYLTGSVTAGGENRYAYSADTRKVENRGDPELYDDLDVGTLPDPTYGTQIPVGRNDNVNRVSDELPVQLKNVSIGTDGSITASANGKTVVIGYIAVASADSPDGVTNVGGHYYKAQGGAGNLRCNALVDLGTGYLGNRTIEYNDPNDPTRVTFTPSAADRIVIDSSNSVMGNGLEASSTDVATEFAEMITAQRGYQVNTRIVSVTDSMLEELANMKR